MRRIFVFCVLLLSAQPLLAQAPDAQAVAKAQAYFGSAKTWNLVNGFVHFGTDYFGHQAAKDPVRTVKNANAQLVPGHFALVYNYQ